jgi:hypothetical protein
VANETTHMCGLGSGPRRVCIGCICSCLEWGEKQLKDLACIPTMIIQGIMGTDHDDAAAAWAERE